MSSKNHHPLTAGLLCTALLSAGYPYAAHADDAQPWHRALRVGVWTRIHVQQPGDAVRFVRQSHGGSAFDTRRGQLILFGSDTHGQDWTNSPLMFDATTRRWSRAYADDAPASYRVNEIGVAVAGPHGNRPWAMHTFAAVTYDTRRDEVIVASYPGHLQPGRFTDVMAHIWPRIRRHATWIFRPASQTWHPLDTEPVHFFPYATAYDSHRDVVIGYRRDGIYELDGEPRRWRRIAGPGLLGYHNNAVYDSAHRALIIFGSHELSNDIVVYRPATGEHRKMPTPGPRPPRAQHVPMAFHPRLGKTVVLIGNHLDKAITATWLYDLAADRWTRIESATLPLSLGMNYNLVYDPARSTLLLVSGDEQHSTAVWALKL